MLFTRRRNGSVVGLLALVAAAIFLLPASQAGANTVSNACINNVAPTESSSIPVTMTATASPNPVEPGGTVTLSEITQELNIPPKVFARGYELELLEEGENNIPVKAQTQIAATNTTDADSTQATNVAEGTAHTTITDPTPTERENGDAEATPGTLTVTYQNQTWVAAATGTIAFREKTVTPQSATVAGITLTAEVGPGGILKAKFGCNPGTVEESAPPSTIVLIDPAEPFASTLIETPTVNEPPTAAAGEDQTVASGASVTLNGEGSSDPNGEGLTYDWTQTGGEEVVLSGANTATATFTAPTGPATLEFQLEVCDEGEPPLCDTDSVVVNVEAPPVIDVGVEAIVNGPTSSKKTSKTVVAKVTNVDGTASQEVCAGDVTWEVKVNGTATGSVAPKKEACKVLAPGGSTKFQYTWTYSAGAVISGDTVLYIATVTVAGDTNSENDTDTFEVIAK